MTSQDDAAVPSDIPSPPVSRRERPAKPPLSREAILDVAMEILDREGLDALSMRRVAHALDTGASSLYVYVRNRDDLLSALVDRSHQNVMYPDPNQGTWQQRAKAVLLSFYDELAAHPGLATVSFGKLPASEFEYQGLEYLVKTIREGGWSDLAIAWALDQLFLLGNANSLEQASLTDLLKPHEDDDEVVQRLADIVERMPMDRFPNVAKVPYYITLGRSRDRYAWLIDCVLHGAPDALLPASGLESLWLELWNRAGLRVPEDESGKR